MLLNNIFIVILFIIITLLTFALLKDSININNVILVNILFRHGDRNPIHLYSNDPYSNMSYWPDGLGQLTNIGKKQNYEFGQYLRKRYKNLLPKEYNATDMKVQSTDVNRTLISAVCALDGFYPSLNIKIWSEKLNWQDIPVQIHTKPEPLDDLLAMKKPCQRYDKEFKQAMKSNDIKNFNKQHKKLYDYVTLKSGNFIHGPMSLHSVYDTLFIENLKGYKLSNWTNKVFPDKMNKVSGFSFTLQAYTKELQKLKSGPLLGEMVKNMKLKSIKKLKPNRKLFLYSAHDTTVANFLMALGLFYPHNPPYTAAIFLQLHKTQNNECFVFILYRNDTSKEPYPLRLSNCSVHCPLDQFIELTKSVRSDDWEAECSISTDLIN